MTPGYWLGIVEGWILAQSSNAPKKVREALAELASLTEQTVIEARQTIQLHSPSGVEVTEPNSDSEGVPARRDEEPADSATNLVMSASRPTVTDRCKAIDEPTVAGDRPVDLLRALNGEKTLDEMAAIIDRKRNATYQLCLYHKIPFKKKPKRGNPGWGHGGGKPKKDADELAVDEAQTTTYIDEQGRTITKCPPRWANGVGLNRHTAKPTTGA